MTDSPAAEAPTSLFLVGCARTGSTLLRHVLNHSPQVTIAPETHFMRRARHLRLGDRLAAASTPSALSALVDTLYTPDRHSGTGYWAWLRRNVPREEFLERLAATDRSEKSLFTLLVDLFSERSRSERVAVWGEKTPSHLMFVPTLVDWYPDAKIVHTFRDPRGMYASELRRRRQGRWGPKRLLPWLPDALIDPLLAPAEAVRAAIVWRRASRLDVAYRRMLGDRYRLVQFEDLVRDPEAVLRDVCDLIGVAFDPALLEVDVVGSSFEEQRHGTRGFDPAVAERWRAHVGPIARAWFRLVLGRQLAERGYRP